ncbi:MAG: enoyl-CoA hydratase/isomerase family protein [Candidatus Melainabacteria bacterium HGW-Melainabacteria-1]|nr:MAG: enoyl-CoA hydratase/isomerase family protein [Candidatus Melainabacteria bacterium HGW-Melainabacteria-1]
MHTLRTELSDGIQTVTLDRGKANPINHQMILEMRQLIAETNHNEAVLGCLLTGKPGYFSAGLDVVELYDYDPAQMKAFWQDLASLLADLSASPKPWVAAISGHSPAGGCVIALCCDQRVMAAGNYRIGLNEVPVGIVVPSPIFDLYASVLGNRQAYQFLMEGKLLLPQDALACGLVDAVVDPEQVLETSRQRLLHYLSLNQMVWRQTKQLLKAPLIAQLRPDFDTAFGPTLDQWWREESRSQIAAMIQKLKQR